MFVFKDTDDVKLCKECDYLKTLQKTQYFPEQLFCAKQGISKQAFCIKTPLYKTLHQCDDCALLGKKTDDKGIQYVTCLSPKNLKSFGYWVKAITQHAYFCPNEICKYKEIKER